MFASRSKLAAFVAVLAGTFAGAEVHADTLDKVRIAKAIYLGHRSSSVPFSYVDKSGTPSGYAVEICKRLAEAIGKELRLPELKTVWIPVGPNERNSSLTDGLIDIDCADSAITAQSQQVVSFTVPIYVASTRLLVTGRPAGTDLGQLTGKKVVTTSQAGNESMLQYVLSQTGVRAETVVARTPKAAMEILRSGRAQALFADDATLFGILLLNKDNRDLTVLPKTYSLRPKAITFRKDEEHLRQLLLREMRSLIAEGVVQKLHERWFNASLQDAAINLGTPISYVLRETWKNPTDAYVDYAYGHMPD